MHQSITLCRQVDCHNVSVRLEVTCSLSHDREKISEAWTPLDARMMLEDAALHALDTLDRASRPLTTPTDPPVGGAA